MTAMPPGDDPDIALLAETLARIRRKAGAGKGGSLPSEPVALAEAIYRSRRRRARFFELGDPLFGEPAWDIMLDLFVRGERGKKTSVSAACLGAAVPPTTALRWIGALQDAGLIQRQPHPSDARSTFLMLSPSARDAMMDYLVSIVDS